MCLFAISCLKWFHVSTKIVVSFCLENGGSWNNNWCVCGTLNSVNACHRAFPPWFDRQRQREWITAKIVLRMKPFREICPLHLPIKNEITRFNFDFVPFEAIDRSIDLSIRKNESSVSCVFYNHCVRLVIMQSVYLCYAEIGSHCKSATTTNNSIANLNVLCLRANWQWWPSQLAQTCAIAMHAIISSICPSFHREHEHNNRMCRIVQKSGPQRKPKTFHSHLWWFWNCQLFSYTAKVGCFWIKNELIK